MTPLKAIHQALTGIRKEGPTDPTCGICSNVDEAVWLVNEAVWLWGILTLSGSLWEGWPHYSGEVRYPVPGGKVAYDDEADLWDRGTEYGRLRWNLLDHVIGVIEGKLVAAEQGGSQ